MGGTMSQILEHFANKSYEKRTVQPEEEDKINQNIQQRFFGRLGRDVLLYAHTIAMAIDMRQQRKQP